MIRLLKFEDETLLVVTDKFDAIVIYWSDWMPESKDPTINSHLPLLTRAIDEDSKNANWILSYTTVKTKSYSYLLDYPEYLI